MTVSLQVLTLKNILSWADAHRESTGNWPRLSSGKVGGARRKTWLDIDQALSKGGRGFAAGSSLAGLLYDRRGVRASQNLVPFTEKLILRWAEQYRRRTGGWPHVSVDKIVGSGGVSWRMVDHALRCGQRGLPGGSSLSRLLEKYFGVRSQAKLPKLTVKQILEWADVHRYNTGEWPNHKSGHIIGAPEEKWRNIDNALRYGLRGFRGGSSIARLLARERGRRNVHDVPMTTETMIVQWADEHYQHNGEWPKSYSGLVEGSNALEDTWEKVDTALVFGYRGLPGGSSLADLLAEYQRKRHWHKQPRLRVTKILKWVDAHRRRTGRWPSAHSGEIVDVPQEKWRNINNALSYGLRGLPGGSSLARLLDQRRR